MNPYYLDQNSRKKLIVCLLIIGSFVAGTLYSSLPTIENVSQAQDHALRANNETYKYVSPLLACQEDNAPQVKMFTTLKEKIQNLTEASKRAGQIEYASIYFRDPYKGSSLGINEEQTYSPASLLKVPLMIAYLKQAETNPQILKKTFLYRKNPINVTPLVEIPLLNDNVKYTVENLIRGMIIDSDNDAKDILLSTADPKTLIATYTELGMKNPYEKTNGTSPEYHVSAKTYALFFRILYNATFLNREMSEKALKILTETKFSKGIRAGIPQTTEIAHKYGVHVAQERGQQAVELSDCGIVYNSTQTYLL